MIRADEPIWHLAPAASHRAREAEKADVRPPDGGGFVRLLCALNFPSELPSTDGARQPLPIHELYSDDHSLVKWVVVNIERILDVTVKRHK